MIKCIFCDLHFRTIVSLREHSARCDKHPDVIALNEALASKRIDLLPTDRSHLIMLLLEDSRRWKIYHNSWRGMYEEGKAPKEVRDAMTEADNRIDANIRILEVLNVRGDN